MINRIPLESEKEAARGALPDDGQNGTIAVADGKVGSVTHRGVQSSPDNWECEAWGSSWGEQKALGVPSTQGSKEYSGPRHLPCTRYRR